MKESVSARCVFYHRDGRGVVKYLFGRRAAHNRNNVGKLQILGGKLEAGETPEDAFHRESEEEAGAGFQALYMEPHIPLGAVTYVHEDGQTQFFHHGFLQRVSETTQPMPKPRADGKPPEHDAFFWLTFKQAKRRKLTPGALDLLEKAKAHLEPG